MNPDLPFIEKVEPYLRTGIALVIFCVRKVPTRAGSYAMADEFIKELKKDIEKS